MRCWVGLSLLICAGAANAATPVGTGRPLASHFDLMSFAVRPAIGVVPPHSLSSTSRWTLHEVEAPLGPPDDPPRIRIRGKHVKLRIPLG